MALRDLALKPLTKRERWLVEQLAAAWKCSETEVREHLDRDCPEDK